MAAYEPRIMAGSCRTATDKQGQWAHAVDVNGWGWEKALCGKAPGIRGNGWSEWTPPAITCPKCLAKLAKQATENGAKL
jgi:hypothetical protein